MSAHIGERIHREIEALGIELEAGIISQEHHDDMVLTLLPSLSPDDLPHIKTSTEQTIISTDTAKRREKRNNAIVQSQNERIDAMEKQIEELSAKLQAFEEFESALFPDVEKMQTEMQRLHHHDEHGGIRHYVRHQYYGDFIPCKYKGVRYWQTNFGCTTGARS